MTREEEIANAADRAFPTKDYYIPTMEILGFIFGARWADEHPKFPWISVKDDLPCNHKELIKNENYTKNVLVVLAWNDDLSKKHIEICDMCNKIGSFNTNWYWRNTAYYHVVCWKPLPELPKE